MVFVQMCYPGKVMTGFLTAIVTKPQNVSQHGGRVLVPETPTRGTKGGKTARYVKKHLNTNFP